MSIGVELSDEDLNAVRTLYKVRWTAELKTWKERDTDYCLWLVSCPDLNGHVISETGKVLCETIYKLLERVNIFPNKYAR